MLQLVRLINKYTYFLYLVINITRVSIKLFWIGYGVANSKDSKTYYPCYCHQQDGSQHYVFCKPLKWITHQLISHSNNQLNASTTQQFVESFWLCILIHNFLYTNRIYIRFSLMFSVSSHYAIYDISII